MNRRAFAAGSLVFFAASTVTGASAESAAVATTPTLIDASYWGALGALSGALIPSLNNFLDLTSAPLPDDFNWQVSVASETRVWKVIYDQMVLTTPTEPFAAFHNNFLEAILGLTEAGDYIVGVIQNVDAAAIQQVNDMVSDGGASIAAARSLMPEFNFAAGCELA